MSHPDVGFRSDHDKWWPVGLHAAHERDELGNDFPDESEFCGWEGIWVCHEYEMARRYGELVYEVDLSGAQLFHEDGDEGFFYIRPMA